MKNKDYMLSPERHEKLDEIKRHLCQCIKYSIFREGWTQTTAAGRLGTSRTRLNMVNRFQTKKLSLSLLFRYLVLADPKIKVLVSLRHH